jgi:hypothetical protein
MTELVARINGNGAGMRMRGVFERLTWPIRKLVWKLEERLVWPLGDVFRRGPKTPTIEPAEPEAIEIAPELAPTAWPTPAPVETEDAGEPAKRFRTPFGGRIDTSIREASLVLGTIAVAIGIGIGVATILGHSGSSPHGSSIAVRPASGHAPASAAAAPSGPATLHGVAPNFKESKDSGPSTTAKAATDTPAAPVAQTNSKPSSIPAGVADTAAAIETARTFSGAFVFYEIGKTNAQVRKTFESTATPALAKALAERPPRLPDNANVPTAKVQNIVLGTEKGNEVEASVSLLRLGTLSELRLTLTRKNKKVNWAVNEVRG